MDFLGANPYLSVWELFRNLDGPLFWEKLR